MPEANRSPFGIVLRAFRQQRGLSQAALSARIAERALNEPSIAALGGLTDKAIGNLEARQTDPSKFVRPRPHTVRILAAGLDIAPGSREERVLLDAAEQTRKRNPARIPPTLVQSQRIFVQEGREKHFQRLREAWALARSGHPQVVVLAGEAGVGKTHLIRELCLIAEHEEPTVRIAWGECTSGASSVSPYLPFLQGMNHLLGLVDRDQATTASDSSSQPHQAEAIASLLSVAPALIGTLVDEAALITAVHRHAIDHPNLKEGLQQVLGARNATDTSGRLDQMVRFITTLAAASPIILVLEDLHWAGEMTAALLFHLQRQLTPLHGVPILIVGSYRPSEFALVATARHPLESVINEMGRQVDNVVIDLGTSIGSGPGLAFIKGLLEKSSIVASDEEKLSEFLLSRTEGHPLFVVELLRWLKDTGALDRDADGLWHLRPTAIQRDAPAKIRAVIAERIGRLPTHLRRILEAACVQGTTVTVDFLADTDTLPAGQLDDALGTQLVTRFRLLQPQDPVQIGNVRLHRYQFRHALFQEYLYETLSLRERERLHDCTAEKSARILGSTPHAGSGEIAYHFERAHRYQEAAIHAYAAAKFALTQLNYDLASHWLQLTETYARHVNDRWHMYAAQNSKVTVMRGIGEFDTSIQLATTVAINTRQHGFHDLEAESEDLLGHVYFDKGDFNAAIHHMTRAATLHRDLGKFAELSGTEAMISHTYYRLGAYDDALVHAQQAYKTAHALDDHAHAAEALLAAGNCEVDLGMYETAIDTYRTADEMYAHAGEVRGELLTALNTGLCHIQLQQWVEAVAILRQARHTTDVLRTLRIQAYTCHYLSLALEGLGDFAAASQEALHSMTLRKSFGQLAIMNDNCATLLRIAIAEGDLPKAREYLRQLETWTNDCGGDGLEDPIMAYLSMAQAYIELGDHDACTRIISDGYALLMERASHIHDDAARRSYLENVPANRKLIAWHTCKEASGPMR